MLQLYDLFYNQNFIAFDPLHSFQALLPPLLETINLFSVSMSLVKYVIVAN